MLEGFRRKRRGHKTRFRLETFEHATQTGNRSGRA